jgi:D-lactate dehydrogenase (cytochrome)
VPFRDYAPATEFVTSIIQSGIPVARCELIDPRSIRDVNVFQGTSYPEEITVFLEFHGNAKGLEQDAELAESLAKQHGALAFESSSDAEERKRLWDARHNMYYACVAANPGKASLNTDVTVPISKLPEAVSRALASCAELGLTTYVVGHVGDGNFHLSLFYDAADAAMSEKIDQVSHKLVMHALAVGGTCTGEHGVGIRKLKYMKEEHGGALELMRAIKQTLDPKGIMNPGKKLPD